MSLNLSNSTDTLDDKFLEELTSNAKQIQDNVLKEILTLNANTEYLQSFLHGSSDKELFKKNVPISSYDDIKPFIDRIANGENSDIISGKPITGFFLSSGTSEGKQKMIPHNNKYLEDLKFVYQYRSLVISKHINDLEHGKGMVLLLCRPEYTTPSNLPATAATTRFFKSHYFKNRSPFWGWSYTSPDQVIICPDNKQSLYCHLLCGLVQRDQVVKVGAAFVSVLVRTIIFLQKNWKELCSDIRSGQLSERISDISCRESVLKILGGSNPELADLIEKECDQKSWEGIIPRLWPKTRFVESIATGQMAQHIPMLEFYSNKLPLVSSSYVSSESMFGINMNPLCDPEDVSYTFMPNFSYFEFLLVEERSDKVEVVDLVDVKLGCYYEPLVTNYSGLHRYKISDVVQVTGFYNNAPQFRFVRRRSSILSVHLETTTDEELLNAITEAKMVLELSNLMLMDFTSYADLSTTPGHYILYLELKNKHNNNVNVEFDDKVLVKCCSVIEESLNILYKEFRDGSIGPLEIKVVGEGSFEAVMEFFISQGASLSQYKTPICIKSSQALKILEERVYVSVFSDKSFVSE